VVLIQEQPLKSSKILLEITTKLLIELVDVFQQARILEKIMDIHIWLSFIATSVILCISSGPTTLLAMGQSIKHGKQAIIPLVLGTAAGDILSMTLSFLGLGMVLSTSATLFTMMKWIGAIYLIYIGVKAFNSKYSPNVQEEAAAGSIFNKAFVVTALNPKGIIFFLAFFPLFIDLNTSVLPQMLILGASFVVIAGLTVTSYSLFASCIRTKSNSPTFHNFMNKTSGSMLVLAGVITASLSKENM